MPSWATLIAQTPSGNIGPFSWAGKFNPANITIGWPIRIEQLHNRLKAAKTI